MFFDVEIVDVKTRKVLIKNNIDVLDKINQYKDKNVYQNIIKNLYDEFRVISKPDRFNSIIRHFSKNKDLENPISEWVIIGCEYTNNTQNKYTSKCICSQSIKNEFFIQNIYNGNILVVGSDCINKVSNKLALDINNFEKFVKKIIIECKSCKINNHVNNIYDNLCKNCYDIFNNSNNLEYSKNLDDNLNENNLDNDNLNENNLDNDNLNENNLDNDNLNENNLDNDNINNNLNNGLNENLNNNNLNDNNLDNNNINNNLSDNLNYNLNENNLNENNLNENNLNENNLNENNLNENNLNKNNLNENNFNNEEYIYNDLVMKTCLSCYEKSKIGYYRYRCNKCYYANREMIFFDKNFVPIEFKVIKCKYCDKNIKIELNGEINFDNICNTCLLNRKCNTHNCKNIIENISNKYCYYCISDKYLHLICIECNKVLLSNNNNNNNIKCISCGSKLNIINFIGEYIEKSLISYKSNDNILCFLNTKSILNMNIIANVQTSDSIIYDTVKIKISLKHKDLQYIKTLNNDIINECFKHYEDINVYDIYSSNCLHAEINKNTYISNHKTINNKINMNDIIDMKINASVSLMFYIIKYNAKKEYLYPKIITTSLLILD